MNFLCKFLISRLYNCVRFVLQSNSFLVMWFVMVGVVSESCCYLLLMAVELSSPMFMYSISTGMNFWVYLSSALQRTTSDTVFVKFISRDANILCIGIITLYSLFVWFMCEFFYKRHSYMHDLVFNPQGLIGGVVYFVFL